MDEASDCLASLSDTSTAARQSSVGGPANLTPEGQASLDGLENLHLEDLLKFCSCLEESLADAWSYLCLAHADDGLRDAVRVACQQAGGLSQQATTAASGLSCCTALLLTKVIPSLFLSAQQSQLCTASAALHCAHEAIAFSRLAVEKVRASYLDLFADVHDLKERIKMTLGGEILVDHAGTSAGTKANPASSETHFELALVRVEEVCAHLEECSDAWLMLHGAELDLTVMAEKSQQLESQGAVGIKPIALESFASFACELEILCQTHHGAWTNPSPGPFDLQEQFVHCVTDGQTLPVHERGTAVLGSLGVKA